MSHLLDFTWYYIIVFLFVLTVIVFVHEWGHYWVARRNNVRVEVFSIGFGPEIFGWTNDAGTRWKISAIPLGGYVKMLGQSDLPEEDENLNKTSEEDKPYSFKYKSLAQRSAIVFAGPLANFILAIILYTALIITIGTPNHYAGIGNIQKNSAAAEAGFQIGDRIIEINGKPITWFSDLADIISTSPDTNLQITIIRNNKEQVLSATPNTRIKSDKNGNTIKKGILGINPDPNQAEYMYHAPWTATWMAIEQTVSLTGNILFYLGEMITGQRGAEDLGGPLRIAQISGQMAQLGFKEVILFMAALSINLGLINLFPIPVLDGGHLMYFAAEAIRGRPLGPRTQDYGFRFGLILLLILMVFATWNDLASFKVIDFIKSLWA